MRRFRPYSDGRDAPITADLERIPERYELGAVLEPRREATVYLASDRKPLPRSRSRGSAEIDA